MRNFYLSAIAVLFSTVMFAQTIVSTSDENKNVVLEEFTGIHCGYCPDGHKIGQQIHDANPNDVFLVNIHTGGYATPGAGEPDFRTSFGGAIASQSGLAGYPAGTVNRHLFSGMSQGSGTAMSRGDWNSTSTTTIGEASYVNVACEATIDAATRELTVHVEAYYTGASPQSTNKLNVVILQDNVEGPQSGASTYNPAQILPNGNYNHMHMLRHMITGQWGEDITTTTTGTFVDRTFNYTIPSDLNGVWYALGNLKILAFVSEGNQEIISAGICTPVISNQSTNDAIISNLSVQSGLCPNISIQPELTISNNGSANLTSLDFEYDFSGTGTTTHGWTGNLAPYAQVTVTLPAITYTSGTLDFNITTTSTNGGVDDVMADNTLLTPVAEAPITNNVVSLDIKPDTYGSEITWNIKNASGTTLSSGGPYTNGNTTLIQESYTYTTAGCYTLNIMDSYGDGILYGSPGYFKLFDSGSTYYNSGDYGSGTSVYFQPDITSSIKAQELKGVNIYPNPTTGIFNISSEENSNITIYNIMGEVVYAKVNSSTETAIDMTNMTKGTYLVKIINDNATTTKKVILK